MNLSLQSSHWMRQEIGAQPDVVRTCLKTWAIAPTETRPILSHLGIHLHPQAIQQVRILGCGTSLHAGWIGKLLLEAWAKLPVTLLPASELRHTLPPAQSQTLTIAITQSGETADVIQGCLNLQDQDTQAAVHSSWYLGVTNQPGSTLETLTQAKIITPAAKEVSIAATKTFTATLIALYQLALGLGQQRQTYTPEQVARIQADLQRVPTWIEQVVETTEPAIAEIASAWKPLRDCIIVGRGLQAAIAAEAALKFKEAAYIHAEGLAAGEFLHGPIALLDETIPVIAIAVPGVTYEAMIKTLPKLKARNSPIVVITTEAGLMDAKAWADACLVLPDVPEVIAPLLTIVPLQLLAYHWAIARQLDPDHPRGLVKSISQD